MTVTTIQRVENGAVAVAVVVATVAADQPWWALLAAFLLFDLSALGYLRGPRAGAIGYNAVHSYTGPAVVVTVYLALLLAGHDVGWVALLAACWAFHVAVDRALGYGLKMEDFTHTHLGRIGRERAVPDAGPVGER
ncbi:DUF4260 family protein [Isoptericola jiangsuensis]|nr:DUF4260 family protein [Isoptericola jiangsuensis]